MLIYAAALIAVVLGPCRDDSAHMPERRFCLSENISEDGLQKSSLTQIRLLMDHTSDSKLTDLCWS